MIDTGDPQQMNAYSYGEDNPETLSDPDGTRPDECSTGGNLNACKSWEKRSAKFWLGWRPPPPYAGDTGHGPSSAAEAVALQRLWAAQQKNIELKQKLANAVGSLIKIAADELGITAGIDCFAHGDLAACGETALNVLLTFSGSFLGKIAAKYGNPFRWAEAAKLVGAVTKLVGTATKAIKDLFKVGEEVRTAEKGLAAACRLNSFVPGTLVRLANGRSKPIEKVKPGDKVLATDPKTGRTRAMPVVATIVGVGHKDLVRITTDPPRGKRPSVIVATAGHPFWTPDNRTWTNAGDLAPGDNLATPSGKTVKILQIHRYGTYQQARNLTVAHLHTYYVQAGTTLVLVTIVMWPGGPLSSITPGGSGNNSECSSREFCRSEVGSFPSCSIFMQMKLARMVPSGGNLSVTR